MTTKLHVNDQVADDLARLATDPIGYVAYAFPWDVDPTIQLREVPAKDSRWPTWEDGTRWGPLAWQLDFLEWLGVEIRRRNFDGRHTVEPIRGGAASGHGIGKGALTAMLVCFLRDTRPLSIGTITANTSKQLETKTWKEICKWTRLSVTGESTKENPEGWWVITDSKGNLSIKHREDKWSEWRVDGVTCAKENSQSFAGQHAATSSSYYVFDEASEVPDTIREVAEGGLTDGEPFMFLFGNPTRNTGHFYRSMFGTDKVRWKTWVVDSRDVEITNKRQIAEWEHDWGVDSDFFRVRVLGLPPSQSVSQLIPSDVVMRAATRAEVITTWADPVIIGVDPARFGGCEAVIFPRKGRDAATIPFKTFPKMRADHLANEIAAFIMELRRNGEYVQAVNIDGGGVGGPVCDFLEGMGFGDVVNEVISQSESTDKRRWADKATECWDRAREWMEHHGGRIPNDTALRQQLETRQYTWVRNAKKLVPKSAMVLDGHDSPDRGDAFTLTFDHHSEIAPALGDPEREGARLAAHDPGTRPNFRSGKDLPPEFRLAEYYHRRPLWWRK